MPLVNISILKGKSPEYKKAIAHHELYISMRDSVENEENQKASYKKQMQFEFDKEKALKEAMHQSEIKEQKAKTKYTTFIGALLVIVALIISLLIYRNNRVKKKIIGIINETNIIFR